MTTNYLHRLDPALIRPGRVDYAQHIDDATEHQVVVILIEKSTTVLYYLFILYYILFIKLVFQ